MNIYTYLFKLYSPNNESSQNWKLYISHKSNEKCWLYLEKASVLHTARGAIMQHTAWPCMATTPIPLQKDTSPFANMSYLFCPILRAWASACLPDMLAGATRRESREGGGGGGHDQLLANMLTHSAPEINSYTIMGVFTTFGVLKTECVIIYIMNSSSQKKH